MQNSSANYVLMFVKHVLKNAKDTTLTIVKGVHRPAVSVPTNVGKWQARMDATGCWSRRDVVFNPQMFSEFFSAVKSGLA